MEIDITNYLNESEIKEICQDELRNQVATFFSTEENAQRLLSNFSYQLIFDEVDKILPNSREFIANKTAEVLNNKDFNYEVFRHASSYETDSLATKMINQSVSDNRQLIHNKVKEAIQNREYSDEVWSTFEKLSEGFMNNIYNLVELMRGKETKTE